VNAIASSSWRLCLLLLGLLVLTPAVRAQPPDARVTRVLADWKRRQQVFQTIRYTLTGQMLRPKGSFPDDMGRPSNPPRPPRDVTEPMEHRLLLDFAKQRFRWEKEEDAYLPGPDKVFPRVSTSVYNNTDDTTASGWTANGTAWPRAVNTPYTEAFKDPLWPDVAISRRPEQGDVLTNGLGLSLGPLLLGHGLVRGVAVRARFQQEFDAEDFVVHGEGVEAGRRCLVLRLQPLDLLDRRPTFDEFWVDCGRESTVLRQKGWANGVLTTDDEIAYQATPQGWLASDWKSTSFRDGRVLSVTRMRVTAVVPEPAVEDGDFRVAIEPGMIVREFTPIEGNSVGATRKDYRVRPDGGWNEIVNGVEKQSLGRFGGRASWAYGLGGGAFMLLVALLVWRRWRRGRRLPPAAPPHPVPSA
jgi:hypothetical protein